MGKIDFSVGEFDTRVELYSPELKQTVSGAVEKNFTVRGGSLCEGQIPEYG